MAGNAARMEEGAGMIKWFIALLLGGMLWGASYVVSGLPQLEKLNDLQMASATQVYDKDGKLLSKLFEQNRIVVSRANMSPHLARAIVANEDTRFYKHMGIDPIGIARALLVNLRTGSIAQGGSTITQQLAREMFLTQERTLTRKLREAVLAVRLDMRFSKDDILEAYLNKVYLGEGAYGVEAAAQKYFGKSAKDLTLAQSAMIAGLARGPALYSPYNDMEAALRRRSVVLQGMVEQGFITIEEKRAAQAEPIVLAPRRERAVKASYFIDYVAAFLVERYGEDAVYRRGLKVYTTLDRDAQQAAESVLGGYQGAVVAIDPASGAIRAMVGGNNYQESQRNRAVQEIRQPGSAFKPFIYAQALEKGYRSNFIIVDEPVEVAGYAPQNYNKKYLGAMTLKKALRWSVNTVAVRLAQQVGMGDVLRLAKELGVTTLTDGDNHLAAALGGLTDGVSLLELTAAYTAFAHGGVVSKPIAVLRVEDEHGQTVEAFQTEQRAVLQPSTAYILTDMLMGVIQGGTGTGAAIGREAAGKTGTTDGYETAWFVGYTPELVAGIFVGNDDRSSVDISGTQVASLWRKFMTGALQGAPTRAFEVPEDVVRGIRVDARTGKLAEDGATDVEYSAFIKGTEPKTWVQKLKEKILPETEQKQPQGKKQGGKSLWEKWFPF